MTPFRVDEGLRRFTVHEKVEIVLLAVLTGLAVSGVARVYDGLGELALIIGGGLVAMLLVAVIEMRRVRLRIALPVSFVAMLLYTAYSQLAGTMPFGIPSAGTLEELLDGLWKGWADGLSALLPLPHSGTTAIFLTFLAWIAGTAGALLLVRWNHVIWPMIPALVFYGITLPLSAPAPGSGWWLPLSMAVAILGLLAFRANDTRTTDATKGSAVTVLARDFQPRTSAGAIARSALPVVLLSAVVGVAAGSVIDFGSDDPTDPRDYRPENLVPDAIINPLTEYKAIRTQDPALPALDLTLLTDSDLEVIGRIPVAVLDDFDGAEWRSSARYRVSGSNLPGGPRHEGAVTVVQSIEVRSIRGPWLPAAERATRISAERVLVDERSGAMIAPASTNIDSYTVTSEVVRAAAERLSGAALEDVDGRFTELPESVPPSVLDLATTLTADAESPYEGTLALADFLRGELFFDDAAAPGHSLGRIESFLFDDQRGSAEQFASALAVMLRTQDIPARLVVGYDLGSLVGEGVDGTYAVTSTEYDVWVEVPFEGLGWQAFDAVSVRAASEPLQEETPGTTIPTSSDQVVAPELQPSEAAPSESVEESDERSRFGAWVLPSLIVGFFVLWLCAFVLLVLVAKRRRRKRRRAAPTPVGQIEGAWADATDRLLEAGVALTPALTLSEIADAGNDEFGLDAGRALRDLVPDVATNAYSLVGPDEATARRAWAHADEFRRNSVAGRSRRQRVSEKLSARPLVKNR